MTMTPSPPALLAQPLTLPCGAVVKNRLLKSAMSEALAAPDFAPTPALFRLYRAWAEGGIGLCVTGNVMIDARARGEPGNVVIEDERVLPALRQWAEAASANGTACWVQLNHPGKQAPHGLNPENVAPSAIDFAPNLHAFFPKPRELTGAEIEALIERFAKAARLVKEAGFAGVQIHGAHGYLVSQFLSPRHNQRSDEWGGSPENRRRFALAVYQAIRSAVGEVFPVGIKLNSADFQRGGFTPQESLDCIRALSQAGIDLIEISGGTYEKPAMTGLQMAEQPLKESTRQREAYFLSFAADARQAAGATPLVVTGGFRSAQGMADALASGAVDMVGLARMLALEPDVPNALLAGREPRYRVQPIRTGIGAIDASGLLEITWYAVQMRRIAAGQGPKPDLSPLGVALKMLWGQFTHGSLKFSQKMRA